MASFSLMPSLLSVDISIISGQYFPSSCTILLAIWGRRSTRMANKLEWYPASLCALHQKANSPSAFLGTQALYFDKLSSLIWACSESTYRNTFRTKRSGLDQPIDHFSWINPAPEYRPLTIIALPSCFLIKNSWTQEVSMLAWAFR